MGRPKKEISEEQVKTLAGINCSYAEMAAVLDCDPKTLTNRFSQAIQNGRGHGRMSLKRKMWETAMGGNVTMMIWLSKQMLGYTDKVEQKHESKVDLTTESKDLANKVIEAGKLASVRSA